MMAKFLRCLWLLGSLVLIFTVRIEAHAQAARFDLVGPKVEVRITRAGKSLPIALVPNLKAGDKLWLHPDLPPTQSVHYLLVAAFLRGTTNPPPDNWFFKIETWNKKVRAEGVNITVPEEAQQAILFLAPETGGDFTTLRAAVRGRPGVFVRASQDLSEAGFEQARIEKYLASMRRVAPTDPKELLKHSSLLARTLNLKPNDECFQRPIDQQYTCLTQSGNQTLLDDGHAQSVVAGLATGSASDFINAASYTSLAGGGVYSAYVGAIVDLVRIMSGLHTAQYQYIPAIAFPDQESLNLRLNTPPSFRNPKSVIVIGLPSILPAVPPPLRPADPKFVTCLLKPQVVLPVEGAPLVFSTGFAHDLVLHINGTPSASDIPLTADAFQGGLILNPTLERKPLQLAEDLAPPALLATDPAKSDAPHIQPLPGAITGTVLGYWGFDLFTGPTLQLQNTPGKDWKLAADSQLIAGRENHLLLTSSGSACIQSISLDTNPGKQADAKWKSADKPNLIDVSLPLNSATPGTLHVAIRQYGEKDPSLVATRAFSEPATLTSLHIHAGDTTAIVTGTSLDQVQQFAIGSFIFTPVPMSPSDPETATPPSETSTSLRMTLAEGVPAPKFKTAEKLNASFTLKDGRTLVLPATVAPPRPIVTLLSKNISQVSDSSIRLSSQDDLPANQLLTFSLKSPSPFPRTGKIEVASPDDSLHTTLTVTSGSLVLQNPHTILGTLDPLKTFGTSAYGPLRLRAVAPDGTTGDWIPLATLVRLPTLTNTLCPADPAAPCTLTGSSLYLVDSIATDSAFTNPTAVPEGFVSTTLSIPRPTGIPNTLSATRPATTVLYLRLRDDPSTPNTVTLPVLPTPSGPAPTRASTPALPKPATEEPAPVPAAPSPTQ
jgi:hypothetical protein